MLIGINPILLSFGPLAVRWFGLVALAGLALAIWLGLRELGRAQLGHERERVLQALAWALPVGVVGARVVHVLGYWDFYLTNSSQLWQLSLEGMSLWGGLACGGLVFAARLRRGDGDVRRRILDTVVAYVALGIGIGRVGEFLDGLGQGPPSSLPWATEYASRLAATPDAGVPRHPSQLYDAAIALGLCAVLLWLARRRVGAPAGTRLVVFLVGYGGARVALGPLRLDPTFIFGLQLEQLIALGSVGVGLVLAAQLGLGGARAWRTARRGRRRPDVLEGAALMEGSMLPAGRAAPEGEAADPQAPVAAEKGSLAA